MIHNTLESYHFDSLRHIEHVRIIIFCEVNVLYVVLGTSESCFNATRIS